MTDFARLPAISEERAGALFDYLAAAVHTLPGKRDHQVAGYVSRKAASGRAFTLRSKELERAFGMDRRTAWRSLRRMVDFRFIRPVGARVCGYQLYEACLERGAEWRTRVAEIEARYAA